MSIPDPIQRLPQHAEELRTLLISWAQQNSGSGNLPGLGTMRSLLAGKFSNLGHVQSLPLPGTEAMALRVRFHPNAPRQIFFSGHYDTVYGTEHPFQLCTEDEAGRLQGPGVADMKGGLVVLYAALRAFAACPNSAAIGGEILLTPDEETGSHHSGALLQEAAKRHAFGLVFEPARENGDLVRTRMGTALFTVRCRGRAAHAAAAGLRGRNAILCLAEFLLQASRLPQELPGVLLNVGRISGGEMANVVPDHAEALLDIRAVSTAGAETVVQRLQDLAANFSQREGYSVNVSGAFNRPPKECTTVEERLFGDWQACAREFGFAPSWQDVGGASDGNLLSAAGLANLDGLGPQGGNLHSSAEYIVTASLVPRAQAAALFLHRLTESGPI